MVVPLKANFANRKKSRSVQSDATKLTIVHSMVIPAQSKLNLTFKAAFTSTPKCSRNDENQHICSRFLRFDQPVDVDHFTTAFSTRPKLVATGIPIRTRLPFIFHGNTSPDSKNPTLSISSKPADGTLIRRKDQAQWLELDKDVGKKLADGTEGPTGRHDVYAGTSKSRSEQHKRMYKSRFMQSKRDGVLRGVRMNRRFDLHMKFREDETDIIKNWRK